MVFNKILTCDVEIMHMLVLTNKWNSKTIWKIWCNCGLLYAKGIDVIWKTEVLLHKKEEEEEKKKKKNCTKSFDSLIAVKWFLLPFTSLYAI